MGDVIIFSYRSEITEFWRHTEKIQICFKGTRFIKDNYQSNVNDGNISDDITFMTKWPWITNMKKSRHTNQVRFLSLWSGPTFRSCANVSLPIFVMNVPMAVVHLHYWPDASYQINAGQMATILQQQQFQIHFLQWKCMDFDSNFTQVWDGVGVGFGWEMHNTS